MITETALLSEVFKAVEAFLGSKLTATDILGRAECRRMVARLMRLKIDWPYRRQPDPGPCNYVFDPRRYPKPAVDYPRSMTATSPFAPLMRELLSSFDSTAQLAHAEAVLADMVGSLARAIVAGRRVRTRTHG
jgi:hypothetical protein